VVVIVCLRSSMNPKFEIECIFKVTLRDKSYVTARLLNSNLDWKLSDKSKLGEVEIENWFDIPRESDTLGNQR
jgi:hypothetical protein